MIPFTDFLSFVLPSAPSVPEPLAVQALRNAAIDFCERTRSWRYLAEIDVAGDDYEIAPVPSQASLFEIEEAWFKLTGTDYWSRPLKRIAFKDIDPNELPRPGDTAGTAAPDAISQINFDTVVLVPLAAGTLRISMFLSPSRSADDAPDFLYDMHADTIAAGALASILTTPDQPYTLPELGAANKAVFNAVCDAKFNQNVRGQQRAKIRTRPAFI